MIDQQRREAQRIRRCIEEEKSRLKSLHSNHTGSDLMSTAEEKVRIRHVTKDAMYSYFSKVKKMQPYFMHINKRLYDLI